MEDYCGRGFDSRRLHHDCCINYLYLVIYTNEKSFSTL